MLWGDLDKQNDIGVEALDGLFDDLVFMVIDEYVP